MQVNIKILLNIQYLQFCAVLRAQSCILRLFTLSLLLPLPPPSIRKMDQHP